MEWVAASKDENVFPVLMRDFYVSVLLSLHSVVLGSKSKYDTPRYPSGQVILLSIPKLIKEAIRARLIKSSTVDGMHAA